MSHEIKAPFARLQFGTKTYQLFHGINQVGRNPNAAVNIKSLSVSQHHAIIVIVDKDQHFLSDLDSSNGSFLNGEKLERFKLYNINNETIIKFANFECLYIKHYGTPHEPLSENTQSQTYTPSFYGNDTQMLSNTLLCPLPKPKSPDKINDDLIVTQQLSSILHEAPTQIVESIHEAPTQFIDMKMNNSVDTTPASVLEFHEAETQLIKINIEKLSSDEQCDNVLKCSKGETSKDKCMEDQEADSIIEEGDIEEFRSPFKKDENLPEIPKDKLINAKVNLSNQFSPKNSDALELKDDEFPDPDRSDNLISQDHDSDSNDSIDFMSMKKCKDVIISPPKPNINDETSKQNDIKGSDSESDYEIIMPKRKKSSPILATQDTNEYVNDETINRSETPDDLELDMASDDLNSNNENDLKINTEVNDAKVDSDEETEEIRPVRKNRSMLLDDSYSEDLCMDDSLKKKSDNSTVTECIEDSFCNQSIKSRKSINNNKSLNESDVIPMTQRDEEPPKKNSNKLSQDKIQSLQMSGFSEESFRLELTPKVSQDIKNSAAKNSQTSNYSEESFKLGLTQMMNESSSSVASTKDKPQESSESQLTRDDKKPSKKFNFKKTNQSPCFNDVSYLNSSEDNDKSLKCSEIQQNTQNTEDIYAQPTQNLNEEPKSLSEKEDIYEAATQMVTQNERDKDGFLQPAPITSTKIKNKANSTLDEIYVQSTQQLNPKLNANENKPALEDIYNQPTQPLSCDSDKKQEHNTSDEKQEQKHNTSDDKQEQKLNTSDENIFDINVKTRPSHEDNDDLLEMFATQAVSETKTSPNKLEREMESLFFTQKIAPNEETVDNIQNVILKASPEEKITIEEDDLEAILASQTCMKKTEPSAESQMELLFATESLKYTEDSNRPINPLLTTLAEESEFPFLEENKTTDNKLVDKIPENIANESNHTKNLKFTANGLEQSITLLEPKYTKIKTKNPCIDDIDITLKNREIKVLKEETPKAAKKVKNESAKKVVTRRSSRNTEPKLEIQKDADDFENFQRSTRSMKSKDKDMSAPSVKKLKTIDENPKTSCEAIKNNNAIENNAENSEQDKNTKQTKKGRVSFETTANHEEISNKKRTSSDVKTKTAIKKKKKSQIDDITPKISNAKNSNSNNTEDKTEYKKDDDEKAANTDETNNKKRRTSERKNKTDGGKDNTSQVNKKAIKTSKNKTESTSSANDTETNKSSNQNKIEEKSIKETDSNCRTTRRNARSEEKNMETIIESKSSEEASCSSLKTPLKRKSSKIGSNPSPKSLKLDDSLLSTPERSKRKLKPKVVFTMLNDPSLESLIRRLGGSVVDSIEACTVLVTKAVQRSQKLLSAIGKSKPICSPSWLEASKKANEFLDPWENILVDKEAEKKWKFKLTDSLERSKVEKLFEGFVFHLLTNSHLDVLKGAIESCGGKIVSKIPSSINESKFVVVCSSENKNKCKGLLRKNPDLVIVEPEAIFDGALRQEMRFEEHLLK